MTVREYIGARYIPLFIGEWDNSVSYEPLSVVSYQGDSYTSRQSVPIGVQITDTRYWFVSGNYNAQVEQYRREVAALSEQVETLVENGALVFQTVAEMKVCRELEVGTICYTNGYYKAGDGGSCWYTVTDTATPNGMDIVSCGDLYAVALFDDAVNVRSVGTPYDGSDTIRHVERALAICKEKGLPLVVPDGEYPISRPIAIDFAVEMRMMPNACFIAMEIMDYMLIVSKEVEEGGFWLESDYIVKPVITGGIFDCDYKAEIGIATDNVLQGLFERIRICNFTDKGIHTHYDTDKPTGASTQFSHIYIWIESQLNNQCYGIYNASNDFNYDHVQIYNCKHGVYTVGGCKFYDVHPWINSADIIENSICFEVTGSGCNLVNCTSDSYANGIKIGNVDLTVEGFRFANAIADVETITFRCFTCSESSYMFNLMVSDFYITRAFTSSYTNFYFVDDVLHGAPDKLFFSNVSLSAVSVIKNADVIENQLLALTLSRYINASYASIYGGAAQVMKENNCVKFNCTLDIAAAITSGTTIMTLPAGWRPVTSLVFGTFYSRDQNKPIRYQIADGNVTVLGNLEASDRITFDTSFFVAAPRYIIQ